MKVFIILFFFGVLPQFAFADSLPMAFDSQAISVTKKGNVPVAVQVAQFVHVTPLRSTVATTSPAAQQASDVTLPLQSLLKYLDTYEDYGLTEATVYEITAKTDDLIFLDENSSLGQESKALLLASLELNFVPYQNQTTKCQKFVAEDGLVSTYLGETWSQDFVQVAQSLVGVMRALIQPSILSFPVDRALYTKSCTIDDDTGEKVQVFFVDPNPFQSPEAVHYMVVLRYGWGE